MDMWKEIKRNRLKGLSVFLAVCVFSVVMLGFVSDSSVVYAADDKTIEELNAEKDALNQRIKEWENQIAEAKKQIANEQGKQKQLNTQITATQNLIADLMNKIDMTNGRISEKQLEITDKELEIEQKKIDISESEELFAKRVRAMYISNTSTSALSVLLSADSLSDLFNQAEVMKRVSEMDNQIIDTLNQQKADLEVLKTDLENQKTELETQKKELDATKSQEAAHEKELDSLLEQSEAAETEKLKLEKKYMASKERDAKQIKAIEAEVDRIIAMSAGGSSYGEGVLKWPVPSSSRITSPFGWRTLYGKKDYHTGIDIGAPKGTAIQAADTGKVIKLTKSNYGYGWHVVLEHGPNAKDGNRDYVTLYAHMSRIDVNMGDVVKKGQTIGGVGTTGNSTGNHLHFEVRVDSKQLNPMSYVKKPN